MDDDDDDDDARLGLSFPDYLPCLFPRRTALRVTVPFELIVRAL